MGLFAGFGVGFGNCEFVGFGFGCTSHGRCLAGDGYTSHERLLGFAAFGFVLVLVPGWE